MKVALCLFGLPRCLELSYILHKYYIIDELNADIFIHTWDKNNGGNRMNETSHNLIQSSCFSSSDKKSLITDNPCNTMEVDNFIKEKIKPKKYLIENYNNFKNINGDSSTAAMYWSIKKSNELKKEFEIENNTKYDLVIISRMDLLFKTNIPYIEIEESIKSSEFIYMTTNRDKNAYGWHDIQPDKNSDMFIFGNNELINIYSNSFDTWLDNKNLVSEEVYYNHLNKFNIKTKISDIKFMGMVNYTINEWYAVYHSFN